MDQAAAGFSLPHLVRRKGTWCVLHMGGGFEIQLRDTGEDVSAQIAKRLNAY